MARALMRLAMTFPAQHDAIKQRRTRAAPMMKLERIPSAAPLTARQRAAMPLGGRLLRIRGGRVCVPSCIA
jgi:hypothetical protein